MFIKFVPDCLIPYDRDIKVHMSSETGQMHIFLNCSLLEYLV